MPTYNRCNSHSILAWIADYLLIPLFIFCCAFEPNFVHGFIDYLEAGQFLSVINEVFYGKVPIKDLFTLFGPLHIYLPALAMLLLGKSLVVLRAYFHFGSIFSLIVAYFLGKSILRSRFFSYLLAFLLILEVNHPFWSTRAGGIRMGLGLLALLFLIWFIKSRRKVWLLLTGILSGFSLLYSIEIGVFSFIASMAGIILVSSSEKEQRIFTGLKNSMLYFGGALSIILPFFVYFYLKGALSPYLVHSFIILPDYSIKVWGRPVPSLIPENLRLSNFIYYLFGAHFKMFLPFFVYAFSVFYLSFKLIKNKITARLITIFIITIYGLLLYKISFRAIYGPQFQAALPALLILGCFFLENFFFYGNSYYQSPRPSIKRTVVLFSVVCILFLSFFYLFGSRKRYYSSIEGWFWCQMNKKNLMPTYTRPIPINEVHLAPLEIERAKGILVPDKQKEEIEGITEYITQNTESAEPIFTFPEHGIYNFFTDRGAIGRFTIAVFSWATKEGQLEILRNIKELKPRYIIFGKRLSNLAKFMGKNEELLPQVSRFIKENYSPVKSFDTTDVLKRRD